MLVPALVDAADAVHPRHRDDDLVAVLERDLAADEPGVARLRHHRDAMRVRQRQDARHFVGRARPQHGRGAADVFVAPFAQVGLLRVGVGEDVGRTDDRGELGDQVGGWRLMQVAL